jgi:hypothetical protein
VHSDMAFASNSAIETMMCTVSFVCLRHIHRDELYPCFHESRDEVDVTRKPIVRFESAGSTVCEASHTPQASMAARRIAGVEPHRLCCYRRPHPSARGLHSLLWTECLARTPQTSLGHSRYQQAQATGLVEWTIFTAFRYIPANIFIDWRLR